jgi:hypothetical protein
MDHSSAGLALSQLARRACGEHGELSELLRKLSARQAVPVALALMARA